MHIFKRKIRCNSIDKINRCDRKESHLSLREFDDKMKRKKYEEQKGICPLCKEHFELSEMEGDHIIPWSKGGKTVLENGQMLCRKHNHEKSDN